MILEPELLPQLADEYGKALPDYLLYKQVCARYERGEKSKLAHLILAAIAKQEGKTLSHAMLETMARGSKEYLDYLAKWNEADELRVKAQIQVDTLANKIEALQSYFAYRRTELAKLDA